MSVCNGSFIYSPFVSQQTGEWKLSTCMTLEGAGELQRMTFYNLFHQTAEHAGNQTESICLLLRGSGIEAVWTEV